MADYTVEQCLRRLEDRAAMLRYLADCAATQQEYPSDAIWSGIADACEDMRQMARAARLVLPADTGDRMIKNLR